MDGVFDLYETTSEMDSVFVDFNEFLLFFLFLDKEKWCIESVKSSTGFNNGELDNENALDWFIFGDVGFEAISASFLSSIYFIKKK